MNPVLLSVIAVKLFYLGIIVRSGIKLKNEQFPTYGINVSGNDTQKTLDETEKNKLS